MSLWTPGGEHPVDRQPTEQPTSPQGDRPVADLPPEIDLEQLSPEERAQVEAMAEEMAMVRQQLLAAPASAVVANHAMGLYELAAIHLTADEPDLTEAALAIDALSCLVEGLAGRLGESEATLQDARRQLQMAFVQRRGDSPE